ncbi:MAG: STAS domain-containing protein [Desulfatirhabdiaceae bacterium]
MQMEDRIVGNVLVLRPMTSTIDASVSILFKGKIIDWTTKGYHLIVLDLSEVEFMDSSGLGILMSLLKTLGKEGRLVLCHIHDSVRSLFKITRVDRIIPICSDVDDAIQRINQA